MPGNHGWTRVRSTSSKLKKCMYCEHLGELVHQRKNKEDGNRWKCQEHGIIVGENDYSCDRFAERSYQREDVPDDI